MNGALGGGLGQSTRNPAHVPLYPVYITTRPCINDFYEGYLALKCLRRHFLRGIPIPKIAKKAKNT